MRGTAAVFADHLKRRMKGDVAGDIAANYDPAVVLLTNFGVYGGHDGAKASADKLATFIKEGKYSYDMQLVEGDYAFLEWSASDGELYICDGVDSFVVKHGKIVFQSIHYTPDRK